MTSVSQSKLDGTNDTVSSLIDVLRRFHYGEPSAAAQTSLPGDKVLPALLNPYRDATAIRYQYPLYLFPPGDTTVLAQPIGEFLSASVDEFALGTEDARILRDNLPWIERDIRQRLAEPYPADAPAMFEKAAAALQDHLDLDKANREKLAADLDRLKDEIADGGQFLGYGPYVSLHLLLHATRHRQGHEQFRRELKKRRLGLQALVDVEKSKDAPDRKDTAPGARYFDKGAVSGMLEQRARGSVAMPAERRARIEKALATLQEWEDDPVLVRLVGHLDDPWFNGLETLDVVDSDEPCTSADGVFRRDAARYAELFAAARIAALEIDDNYQADVHDSWFASFDWQAFSHDEMQLMPKVVALVSADYLAGDGLPSFSRLLGSRLPVHVLSWIRAYDNPAAQRGEDPFATYRFELAYLGIGHRQVVVAQTSAARHGDLLAGFLCALDSDRASLHLVNRGTQTQTRQPLLDPWFVASAALESRAHPLVIVNPDAGDHAAERVSFEGNPQPESDWPVEKLEYRDADGEITEMELAFTFADYALLMPTLHDHFRTVPKGFESEDLLPVDRFLELGEEQAGRPVPFVWGIDEQGELVRLVVSRALVFACRDRLNYWRTLQELAGIQNYYVEEAIDRVVAEQQAALAAERERLRKAHEEELESVRTEAAGEAMGQLVDVLMGADLSDMIDRGGTVASMPATEAAPATVAPKTEDEPEAEAEEELSFDEPWLDTASCTTCDDCMGVNKMMFAYNDDKQAIISDPRAGTYADLVEAAEICPAKCIHPGKPLDPDEPGLEELMARAAPFN